MKITNKGKHFMFAIKGTCQGETAYAMGVPILPEEQKRWDDYFSFSELDMEVFPRLRCALLALLRIRQAESNKRRRTGLPRWSFEIIRVDH